MSNKQLVPKETVIGSITANLNGKPSEYKILYGNWASPKVNGIDMHLSNDAYEKMLTDFLRSAEGEEFDAPSDQEKAKLRRDVELDIKIQEEKRNSQPKKKPESEPEKVDNSQFKDIALSLEALTTQMNSIGEQVHSLRESMNSDDEDDEDDEEYEETGANRPTIILIVICLVACLANIGLSFLIMTGSAGNKASEAEEADEKTRNTLVIDGQTYTIESTPVKLEDGQTKVSMYAIATTNEGGKSVNKVIPLGDVNVANIEKAAKEAVAEKNEDTEKPASTATPESDSDAEKASGGE